MTKQIIFIRLILIAVLIGTPWKGDSQEKQWEQQKIPTDPAVKIGELDNGIRYFIRHNNKAEDKAELRLVINAGSVLETQEQQGIAHFLEHMAFNGTTHFEKNELIGYLQSLGVEFGADLNAHTSFDETVYKLTIPTNNQEILNDGFQIIRDWADGITLAEEDIDAERGVVAEELRSGLSSGRRMFNEYVGVITNDSRYSERLPIGKLDVIMNAPYEEIRSFYRDWYRPGLMGIVVVGDIDPDVAEKKIKEYFGDMEAPSDTKERKDYTIPDNEGIKVAVTSDEEADAVNFWAYYKKDKKVSLDLGDLREDLLENLYTSILNQRLDDLQQKGEVAFLSGSAGIGNFIGDKSAYFIGGSLKQSEIKEGIRDFIVESERLKQHGVTPGELQRHKRKLLNQAEIQMKEEGKLSSRYYLEQYIDHFMEGEPIPSDSFLYQFYNEQLPGISLEEVNAVADKWIGQDNIAVVLTAPEQEDLDLPSEKEIQEIIETVSNQNLKPYQNALTVDHIMDEKPRAGRILNSEYFPEINTTELTLSNGVTVVLKPTEFQTDLINMSSFRAGGSSLAPDSLYVSARNAGLLINGSGVNGISGPDLEKLTMGQTVSVSPYINFYDELVNGTSSREDLETMLQLTYLYFTAPNKNEDAFRTMKERLIARAKNPDADPYRYFYRKVAETITDNHLRAVPITAEQYEEEFKLDQAYQFYKERFSNADDFTFIFVGSFDPQKIKPLIAQYLGSLPSNEVDSHSGDIGLRYVEGGIDKTYYKGKEDKASVIMRFVGGTSFTPRKKQMMDALERVLRLKLYEELREEQGGVYGVRVSGYATDVPYQWYRVNIEFTCAPENVEDLIDSVWEEIADIKEDGVSEGDLEKIKKALRLNAEEGLKYNGYWINQLKEVYSYDLDPLSIADYTAFADQLTAEDLQEAAQKYLIKETYAQFVLLPEDLEPTE